MPAEAPEALWIILRGKTECLCGLMSHRDGGPSGSHHDEAAIRVWEPMAKSSLGTAEHTQFYLALELKHHGRSRMLKSSVTLGSPKRQPVRPGLLPLLGKLRVKLHGVHRRHVSDIWPTPRWAETRQRL